MSDKGVNVVSAPASWWGTITKPGTQGVPIARPVPSPTATCHSWPAQGRDPGAGQASGSMPDSTAKLPGFTVIGLG